MASLKEKPYIEGIKKNLRLIQGKKVLDTLPNEYKEFGIEFCKRYENLNNVKVDITVNDGDILDWFGGCMVVETPGHTPGHTSLYLKNEKI